MQYQSVRSYPLDNSAIIHLASIRKDYTNAFRIVVTLKEYVCPEILQKALDCITPRFPTVIAGIHRGFFQYKVVPVKVPPQISLEQDCLAPMTKNEIKKCAVRILYREDKIVAEFFHSLTDGYGGMVVMTTLIAEYLHQKYGISVSETDLVLDVDASPTEKEVIDDYFTYAGKKATTLKHRNVYQLSGKCHPDHKVCVTTEIFDTDRILDAAHQYDVSATTFLCAVMAASVMEIQCRNIIEGQSVKPVQIMIPVNLRRLFPSQTLRNFSLFALSSVEQKYDGRQFEELIHCIEKQLTPQISQNNMEAIMAGNTKAERFPLYRAIPLPLKWLLLRLAHKIFGEGNSCISLSNLGVVQLPKEMSEYIEGIDFMLTPRIKSPYNCGIVSFDGMMSISFSRTCIEPELEEVFIRRLKKATQI